MFGENEKRPIPLTIYGATDCDDTQHVREQLVEMGVTFREVNIDHDKEAESFVVVVNSGYRSTPTLLFGERKLNTLLTEPTDDELKKILSWSGHLELVGE